MFLLFMFSLSRSMIEPKKPKTFGPKNQSPEINDNQVENDINGDENINADDNSLDEGKIV